MDPTHIRNFCIIAHIDHGKSTLADRLLEMTGAVDVKDMVDQRLDTMDLERERGITIKAQAVRLKYLTSSDQEYQLNLIDTPGHVDFSYEVSRSLAACEGALLVVDASQGIEAQTLANVYLAMEHNLEIIPIINKIDLDIAESERVAEEVQQVFGFKREEIIFASAKDGTGIDNIFEAIVERIPAPKQRGSGPLRALIFDSKYDSYKGVIVYVRVFDGVVPVGTRLKLMSAGTESEALEVGCFQPDPTKVKFLQTGEVGYIATGLKSAGDAPVGDTVTLAENGADVPLDTYSPLTPMVFAGLYPSEGEDYLDLRDALQKLQLNDAALSFQPEHSIALGSGFRCGFLGLLHMDIVQERLEREYEINLLATSPSVIYKVLTSDQSIIEIDNPALLPPSNHILEIQEPWIDLTVVVSASLIGAVMDLVKNRRGEYKRMEYIQNTEKKLSVADDSISMGSGNGLGAATDSYGGISRTRVLIEFSMPLSEMLVDFFDQLKSRTQGYASMDYSLAGYRLGNMVRLDILVNGEPVDALSAIVHREGASNKGRDLVNRLKDLIPRQLFEVPIQAAIGNKVLARQTVKALRKNVLAKCYGGDVTRKRKLLEKQAQGKKRMKRVGKVDIPQEAFLSILKTEN